MNKGQAGSKRRRPVTPTSPTVPESSGDLLPAIEKLLDAKIDKLNSRFDTLESRIATKVSQIESKLDSFAESLNFLSKEIEEVKKVEIHRIQNKLEEERLNREKEIDRISSYICRENLVIMGIPELTEKEDTDKVVREFYRRSLKMEEGVIREIEHQRVHRVPAVTKPRPIKVRFLRYSDKVKVQQNGRLLKGTSFYILDDLPKRVRMERSRQLPALRAAKEEGKIAFFSRAEPWKLVIIEREDEGRNATRDRSRNTNAEKDSRDNRGNVKQLTEEGMRAMENVNMNHIAKEDQGKKITMKVNQNTEDLIVME